MHRSRHISTIGILAGALALSASPAAAVSSGPSGAYYSDSFIADPSTFSCGYFGTSEICGTPSLFPAPRIFNAGDMIDESLAFTKPVVVPGSVKIDGIYIALPDTTAIEGPAPPGPYQIYGSMALYGYSGPSNPIAYPLSFSNSTASGYVGFGGFCCGYGVPNSGFSVTGAELKATILTSDPNPVYGLYYGYGSVLPATPQLLANIAGGTPGHPAILPEGEIGQLAVDLSGQGDTAYYTFRWAGGLFQATGSVANAQPNGSYTFQLEDLGGASITSATLDGSDAFSSTLEDLDLSPGQYIIGVTADSPNDPMFTLDFNTPVESTLGVPESATWTLLVSGFGLLGAGLRTRRRGFQTAGPV